MKIYNTMTRKKEEFVPIDENEIKMYVCGPTVYNYIHIGNARPAVVFDTMRRYMEYKGKNVKFVQNFTDVDDKIINKSLEEGVSAREISEKYIGEYFRDAEALNLKKATVHPKVTENMDEIIAFVKALVEKGYAYEADGDVYYRTRRFGGYGRLSGQNIEDLEAGARISVGEKKRIRRILLSGRREKSTENLPGRVHGGSEDRAGISNVLRCPINIWGKPSIFTAGDRIWRFLTMKTKSLRPKRIPERNFPITGCTMHISRSTTRKCRNRRVIFSP